MELAFGERTEGKENGMSVNLVLARGLQLGLPAALKRDGLGDDAAGAWVLEAVRNVLELRTGLAPDARAAVRAELALVPSWRRTGTKDDLGASVSWDYANPALPTAVDPYRYEFVLGLWRWACSVQGRGRLERRLAWARGPRPLYRFKHVERVDDIAKCRRGRRQGQEKLKTLVIDVPEKELERWQRLARLEGFPDLGTWMATMAEVQIDLESSTRWHVASTVLSGESVPMVAVVRSARQLLRSDERWEELSPGQASWLEPTMKLARAVAAVAG